MADHPTAIGAHTGDTGDAHDASAISFAPAGTIAATDVQAAIEEVAAEAGGGGTAVQPVNHGLLVWNYDPALNFSFGGASLGTAGTIYTISLWLPTAMSVTNIEIYVTTAGATLTAGQCFAALYGSANALIGVSGDQATAWQSTGAKKMALAGGPFTVPAGLVNVGLWWNGSTNPQILRAAAGASGYANYGLAAADSRFGSANTGRTTTAPDPLGTRAASGSAFWVGLS